MKHHDTMAETSSFGDQMRRWRASRRLSQLDLAGEAGCSARHLSFLETGRSRPSREMVERLAAALELSLRATNALLLSAGFAPRFPERPLDHPALAPAHRGIRFLLDAHHPFPAFVVDRLWNVVASNRAHELLFRWMLGPDAVRDSETHRSGTFGEENNILHLVLAPNLLRPFLANWSVVACHLIRRLERQLSQPSSDDRLERLYGRLIAYPGVAHAARHEEPIGDHDLLVPTVFQVRGRRLAWYSTLASFGAAVDVTLAEILIESLHPMDTETAETATELITQLEAQAVLPRARPVPV